MGVCFLLFCFWFLEEEVKEKRREVLNKEGVLQMAPQIGAWKGLL
jgi:hypothetical protein